MVGTVERYETKAGERRWRIRWDIPPGPDGRRRQRTKRGFRTKKEASAALAEVAHDQANRGRVSVLSTVTLGEYAQTWLDSRRDLKPTSLDNLRTGLVHIVPRLGKRRVQEVSADDVAWLYGELAERGKANGKLCRTAGVTCGHGNDCAGPDEHAGLKPKSLGHVHAALRSILDAAVEDGLIITNPCDTKRARQARPRGGKTTGKVTERQCWTDAQARGFIGGGDGDPLHPLWQVVLGSGLRRGEAVGLRWEHVDLERGLLNVRRSVTVVRGQPVVDEYGGKTDAAYRTIVLGDELADVLRAHHRRQAEERLRLGPMWVDSDTVFPAVDGQPLNPGQASKGFTRATAAAGLPAIGLHGLRHTHATMLLRAGVPITAVSQRLGHEDPSITLSTYAHAIPADDALAADATGRVLFQTMSE
jgi:integrase